MGTELLHHKLGRAFAQMDVDGKGKIKRDDLLGLGARILIGFGESPTSPTGSRLVHGFESLWQTLSAEIGADGDGSISPQEFQAGMISAFGDGDRSDPVLRSVAEAIGALCDADGDGAVGPAEFRVMLTAFGTAHDDVDAAFDRLDRDHDGSIPVGELIEAVRQYYTSTDPNATGNWLFGPL
ncbi:EF-hand domain-containing protein [Streptosporangium sp. NPDC087985]|uniref:EF-hand domain-containing protein n=1 Tax=Streptosporangium sp. NPDC087985 TaxID=3366196 RepID=UPI0037F354B9